LRVHPVLTAERCWRHNANFQVHTTPISSCISLCFGTRFLGYGKKRYRHAFFNSVRSSSVPTKVTHFFLPNSFFSVQPAVSRNHARIGRAMDSFHPRLRKNRRVFSWLRA